MRCGYYKPRAKDSSGWERVTVPNIRCDYAELSGLKAELERRGVRHAPHRGDECPWRKDRSRKLIEQARIDLYFALRCGSPPAIIDYEAIIVSVLNDLKVTNEEKYTQWRGVA